MYLHLSREQRLELGVLRREGFSLREIAKRLGVSARNHSQNGTEYGRLTIVLMTSCYKSRWWLQFP